MKAYTISTEEKNVGTTRIRIRLHMVLHSPPHDFKTTFTIQASKGTSIPKHTFHRISLIDE